MYWRKQNRDVRARAFQYKQSLENNQMHGVHGLFRSLTILIAVSTVAIEGHVADLKELLERLMPISFSESALRLLAGKQALLSALCSNFYEWPHLKST